MLALQPSKALRRQDFNGLHGCHCQGMISAPLNASAEMQQMAGLGAQFCSRPMLSYFSASSCNLRRLDIVLGAFVLQDDALETLSKVRDPRPRIVARELY